MPVSFLPRLRGWVHPQIACGPSRSPDCRLPGEMHPACSALCCAEVEPTAQAAAETEGGILPTIVLGDTADERARFVQCRRHESNETLQPDYPLTRGYRSIPHGSEHAPLLERHLGAITSERVEMSVLVYAKRKSAATGIGSCLIEATALVTIGSRAFGTQCSPQTMRDIAATSSADVYGESARVGCPLCNWASYWSNSNMSVTSRPHWVMSQRSNPPHQREPPKGRMAFLTFLFLLPDNFSAVFLGQFHEVLDQLSRIFP